MYLGRAPVLEAEVQAIIERPGGANSVSLDCKDNGVGKVIIVYHIFIWSLEMFIYKHNINLINVYLLFMYDIGTGTNRPLLFMYNVNLY